MNRDELIEMATQVYGECVWHETALLRLESFVKLVAQAEREACARIVDPLPYEILSEKILERKAALIRARGEA